jgi:hypothetical protein
MCEDVFDHKDSTNYAHTVRETLRLLNYCQIDVIKYN